MADLDIVGCGWIECPAGKYKHVTSHKKLSICQIEVFVLSHYFLKLILNLNF
jgi:hypothetical protein